MKILFVAFYLVCLLLGANCDQQGSRENPEQLNSEDNSSVHGQVITPEEDPVAYNGAFEKLLQILWKNFGQELTLALDGVPKNKPATFEDELPPSISAPSEATDLQKNAEAEEKLTSRKFNPRSLALLQAKQEQKSRFPGSSRQAPNPNGKLSPDPRVFSFFLLSFSGDRGENGLRYRRQVEGDTSSLNGQEGGPTFPNLFKLPEFLLKSAHLDIFGLPGHPVRRIVEFLREKMYQKQGGSSNEETFEQRLMNRLLEGGKDLLGKLIF